MHRSINQTILNSQSISVSVDRPITRRTLIANQKTDHPFSQSYDTTLPHDCTHRPIALPVLSSRNGHSHKCDLRARRGPWNVQPRCAFTQSMTAPRHLKKTNSCPCNKSVWCVFVIMNISVWPMGCETSWYGSYQVRMPDHVRPGSGKIVIFTSTKSFSDTGFLSGISPIYPLSTHQVRERNTNSKGDFIYLHCRFITQISKSLSRAIL